MKNKKSLKSNIVDWMGGIAVIGLFLGITWFRLWDMMDHNSQFLLGLALIILFCYNLRD